MNPQKEPGHSFIAWSESSERVTGRLHSNIEMGLTGEEVEIRRSKFGENKLREYKKKSVWSLLAHQFKSLIIGLLLLAAMASVLFGEFFDAWAIIIVIAITVLIGFFTELKAVRSMEALYHLGRVKTRVLRDGKQKEVDAVMLVPGDIVLMEGGDVITADARVIECSGLQVDESVLTGESLPVSKQTEALPEAVILAERSNMLYKGTAITRGSGKAVVVSTGMETELGVISSLIREGDKDRTPLEKRMDRLGNRLIWVTMAITVMIIMIGVAKGEKLVLMIQTGIALAVAMIPEGLPVVATIALAKGVKKMADNHALIIRLASVETLGSAEIICTDKTGTLTENRMSVKEIHLPGRHVILNRNSAGFFQSKNENIDPNRDPVLKMALETGVLCNNASLEDHEAESGSGDPLEVALLAAGFKAGITREQLSEKYPEVREDAFDPEVKMMAAWNQIGKHQYRVSVKGAPEAVLDACESVADGSSVKPFQKADKVKWKRENDEMAARGLRIIALAYKSMDNAEGFAFEKLIFVGLLALLDPPRKDVRKSIEVCRNAGIRVVMVTGDQAETARYIAGEVGLQADSNARIIHGNELTDLKETNTHQGFFTEMLQTDVFARISPAQKLDLIELFQSNGRVIAMTGDGVNDAPALKRADIGIAMGKRGSQVAREAADMILTDDAFSSIVLAIEQGRVIFDNIRRFIYYLMSCNVSEVMVIALAFVIGTPLPILPLQILFLNMVTDVFPALALGVGEGEKGLMNRPPRNRDHSILTKNYWLAIGGFGILISISVLMALWTGIHILELQTLEAVTISFLTLAFAQLWHVFNVRSTSSTFLDNIVIRNPFVWGALLLSSGLIIAALYIPPLSKALTLHPPGIYGWAIIFGFSIIPLLIGQLFLQVKKMAGISPFPVKEYKLVG